MINCFLHKIGYDVACPLQGLGGLGGGIYTVTKESSLSVTAKQKGQSIPPKYYVFPDNPEGNWFSKAGV